MSTTGLAVLDKSLHTTNIWLDQIADMIGPDRQVAWKVLSVVLHKLRDCLPVELAANLSAQLPLIVRGVFYDQYEPARQPVDCPSREAFLESVGKWLSDTRPIKPELAVNAVFDVMARHITAGELAKVRQALPKGVRAIWDDVDAAADAFSD